MPYIFKEHAHVLKCAFMMLVPINYTKKQLKISAETSFSTDAQWSHEPPVRDLQAAPFSSWSAAPPPSAL